MKNFGAKKPLNTTPTSSPIGLKAALSLNKKSLAAFPTRHPLIQPKLRIGQPNDKYELEADRVADQVMRIPESKRLLINSHSTLLQRQSTCPECKEETDEPVQTKSIGDQITPLIQREEESEIEEEEEEEEPVQAQLNEDNQLQRQEEEPEEEEEEEKTQIQTKQLPNQTPHLTPGLQNQVQSMKGGGQPLPKAVRNYFEPRFGLDFSDVKVHTDSKAAETAKSIDAKAFTIGREMMFGAGQYSPDSVTGKRLLAHELTHVVQQEQGKSIRLRQVPNLQKTAVDQPVQVLYPTRFNTLQRKSCPTGFGKIEKATWFHCGEAGARDLACAVCTAAGKRDCNCSNIIKALGNSNIIAPRRIGTCGDIFELNVPGRTDPPIEVVLAERPGGVELDIHRDVIPLLGLSVNTGRYTVCLKNTGRRNNKVMRCGSAKCTP